MTAGWAPGPNHPDYGRSYEPRARLVPGPRPKVQTPDRRRYTLPQLIREYAKSHNRWVAGTCGCHLCADLRWHEQQAREKRQQGGEK